MLGDVADELNRVFGGLYRRLTLEARPKQIAGAAGLDFRAPPAAVHVAIAARDRAAENLELCKRRGEAVRTELESVIEIQ